MNEFLLRLRVQPMLAGEILVASLFVNILGLASAVYVIQVLRRYVSFGVDTTLITLATGAVIAILLEFGLRHVRLQLAKAVSARRDRNLAGRTHLSLATARTGPLSQRLAPETRRETMAGLNVIQQAYAPANLTAMTDLPFSLLFVAALFFLNTAVAVTACLFLAAIFAYGVVSTRMLKDPVEKMTQASIRGSALVASLLRGDSVRAFNWAPALMTRWRETYKGLSEFRSRVDSQRGLAQAVTHNAQALMTVAVIGVGAMQVVAGEFEVAALIGANILAARALAPLARFAQLAGPLERAREAFQKIRALNSLPPEPRRGTTLPEFSGRMEFIDLTFRFPRGSGPLFERLSVDIPAGSLVAVTGGNGTGKTTLARLLVHLIEPARGQILADGVDLRQVRPAWWRRQVLYLPQEPQFFQGTIFENLRTLDPDLDSEAARVIAERACLSSFLDQSPRGLNMFLRGGGIDLAVGTRKRIALARALTSKGRVAVFDEPEEGLDEEGRNAVAKVISGLIEEGRTVFLFTHDKDHLQLADILIDLNRKPVPDVTKSMQKKKTS